MKEIIETQKNKLSAVLGKSVDDWGEPIDDTNPEKAKLLAADRAGARVDPNEAQKAMAYLRSTRDSKEFFRYLRSINANGGIVIRSGQTLGYYRDLLAACDRHLHGLNADEMLQTLGWALRLLRYYRAVPDAQIRQEKQETTKRETQPQQTVEPVRKAQDALSSRPVESASPSKAQIPEAGEIFGGEVLEIDAQGVRIKVKNLSPDIAIGVIKTANLAGKQYQKGGIARIEVLGQRTLPSSLVVLDVKPAPKKSGKKDE